MLLQDAIDECLVAARQAGLSDATLRQYGWHLEKMEVWLSGRGIVRLGDVSRSLLREWGAGLRDSWSPATIKQAISAARSFFAWCYAEGLVEADTGRALKVPRVPARVQRTLAAGEIRRLLAACDETATGRRNAAVVSLLVDSGLRAAELCRLRVGDVHLETGTLVIVGKGGDEAFAYFGQATAERLRAWLAVRPSVRGVQTMFVSMGGNSPGRPLTTSGLRNLLRRLGQRAGVDGVSPHAFRRAFACLATEAGAPSRVVMGFGRWSNVRMVELYTRSLQAGKLYRRYSPVDFLENGERREAEQ